MTLSSLPTNQVNCLQVLDGVCVMLNIAAGKLGLLMKLVHETSICTLLKIDFLCCIRFCLFQLQFLILDLRHILSILLSLSGSRNGNGYYKIEDNFFGLLNVFIHVFPP